MSDTSLNEPAQAGATAPLAQPQPDLYTTLPPMTEDTITSLRTELRSLWNAIEVPIGTKPFSNLVSSYHRMKNPFLHLPNLHRSLLKPPPPGPDGPSPWMKLRGSWLTLGSRTFPTDLRALDRRCGRHLNQFNPLFKPPQPNQRPSPFILTG